MRENFSKTPWRHVKCEVFSFSLEKKLPLLRIDMMDFKQMIKISLYWEMKRIFSM